MKTTNRTTGALRALVTAVALTLLAGQVVAGAITSAATRAALGGTDTLAWGTAADDLTPAAASYTSAGGLAVSASAALGMTVAVQNGQAFVSNFSDGDVLLTTLDGNLEPFDGPTTLRFANAIAGLGFNIAAINNGSFTGTLDFYGVGDVLFGSVGVNGVSSFDNDGTAVFLGGSSSLTDIVRVDISVTAVLSSSALAINELDLLTERVVEPPVEVPEPASLPLLALAAGAAFAASRRR